MRVSDGRTPASTFSVRRDAELDDAFDLGPEGRGGDGDQVRRFGLERFSVYSMLVVVHTDVDAHDRVRLGQRTERPGERSRELVEHGIEIRAGDHPDGEAFPGAPPGNHKRVRTG